MAKPETLAAIKAKFPAVNLRPKRLTAIADKLETKVTDDFTLDAAIDQFNDFNPIADIAKADDREAELQKKLKESKTTPPKDEDKTDDPIVPDENMPAWAKLIVDQNKQLASSLQTLQAEKIQGTIRQKATDALKEVPASYWGKRAIPEKEEDLEAFVTDVKTDYSAFTKELTEQGIKVMPMPKSGAQPEQGSKAVSAEVKNFMATTPKPQPAAGAATPAAKPSFINTPAPL